MSKINKHIEIVRSTSAGLSSMGKKSCLMIQNILQQHYEQVGVTIINDHSDLEALAAQQPDLVFLGVKKIPFNNYVDGGPLTTIWLSAYLDGQGLRYTGSKAAAIALDFDKPGAKQVVAAAGLKTATFFTAKPGDYQTLAGLPFDLPLFVKPPNGGGGKGIGADSVVRDFAAFERKVQAIHSDFGTEALVEQYLEGREFSVAILEKHFSRELMAMPIELITKQNSRGDRILGEKVKAEDTEHVRAVPAGRLKNDIVELALSAFRALGARDYGRIDIRLDRQGNPYFLEANLIPGLAKHDFTSYFTSACFIGEALDYEAMILHIAGLGLERQLLSSQTVFEPSSQPHAAPLPEAIFEAV